MLVRWAYLPLVSREWKNGSNTSYNCTPFLHSLLTKGGLKGTAPIEKHGLKLRMNRHGGMSELAFRVVGVVGLCQQTGACGAG